MEWPSTDSLKESGLQRDDVRPYWTIMEPLAASVGLRFSHDTDDASITTLRFFR